MTIDSAASCRESGGRALPVKSQPTTPSDIIHRVEDTHTRKAAVELEGLREALRRAGYTRAPSPASPPRQTQRERVTQTIGRVVRQVRALRTERLAPVQRLAESVRQWLGRRRGVEQTQHVTARETMTQQVTQQQSRGIRM